MNDTRPLFAICLLSCCVQWAAARKVEGYIYDAQTKEPLVAANINDENKKTGTFSIDKGYFCLNLPEDASAVFVSFIGYNEQKVHIDPTNTKPVKIYLARKINSIDEVMVTARKNDKLQSSQMGLTTLKQADIKNVPTVFGEADVIKALQMQPGVSAGIEGFAGMYVRGGNDDENLFLIDGNPLYQINHLGGLFSAFNVEAIDDISFYKAAFPARYGGRLSSVVDIKTKDGDYHNYHGSLMLGLTSGNVNIGGPIVKGRTSFAFSMRRSWLELVSVPALALMNIKEKKMGRKVIGGYSFTDLNFKINHLCKDQSKLSLLFYYGADRLKIGEKQFSTKETEASYTGEDINKLKWGNLLTALNWQKSLNDRLKLELNASYTRYTSSMNQSVEDTFGNKGEEDYTREYNERNTQNGINDVSFNARLAYAFTENHRLLIGANYTYHHFNPEKIRNISSNPEIQSDSIYTNQTLRGNEFSVYVDDDIAFSSAFKVNAGIRLNGFSVRNKTYFTVEPRLSARVSLSRQLSLKAGYARMSQFVQQVSDSYISLPTDFWMPINEKFKPLISDQVSMGLYYSQNNNYTFSVEGYYKWMNNLLEYKDGYNLLPSSTHWDSKLTSGSGTAYGVDFMAEKNIGRLKGFVGYGLMWTNRHFAEINQGRDFPSKYDNRHKLNIALSYSINSNIDINCGWTYMTGNRVTLSLENYQDLPSAGFPSFIAPSLPNKDGWGIDYYDSKNNVRLPAYHRLDLGMNIYRPQKNGRMGIWNVSIYNAYSRMNPIVIQKSTIKQTTSGKPVPPKFQTLSIFPIIPSVSYTYKF